MEESYYINLCLQLVEKKFLKGAKWTNQDFKLLIKQLHQSSNILISLTTLKRMYGLIPTSEKYNPQLDTKNALAVYLGYIDWQDFRVQNAAGIDEHISSRYDYQDSSTKRFEISKKQLMLVLLLFIVSTIIIMIWMKPSIFFTHKPSFTFSGKNVKGYVPLTAVFNYNITKVDADTVILDLGRSKYFKPENRNYTRLDKRLHTITKTYMEPRFYKVNLIIDKDTIPVSNVHVLSHGWQTYVLDDNNTILKEIRPQKKNGELFTTYDQVLYSIRHTSEKEMQPRVEFRNIKDFNADGDNLTIEIRVKNNAPVNMMHCDFITFLMQGENNPLLVSFVTPGCTGYTRAIYSELVLNGAFTDLSNFGTNLRQWITIRMSIKDKMVRMFLNGKKTYQISYHKPVGSIKGLICAFNKSGSMDYIKLWNKSGKLVYEDNF